MLHYCIFKGIDTRTLGIKLGQCPPRVSPKQRITEIVVPGRHGALTETDGTYEPFTRSPEFIFHGLEHIDQIMALFKGSGMLTFDDELDKVYRARVVEELSAEWFTAGWRKLTVPFQCQPFAYERFPQTVILTASGTLYNAGTVEAQPTIKLYGSGDLSATVNGNTLMVKGVITVATVDCENMVAYEGQTLLTTVGDYPVLPLGQSAVSFTADKIEITPHWRWL